MPTDVTALVLISLCDGPKHGYAIQDDIEQIAAVRLGPGSLYGAVARLEDEGLIEALEVDGRRQPYQITGRGVAALRERTDSMRTIFSVAQARLSSR